MTAASIGVHANEHLTWTFQGRIQYIEPIKNREFELNGVFKGTMLRPDRRAMAGCHAAFFFTKNRGSNRSGWRYLHRPQLVRSPGLTAGQQAVKMPV